LPGIFGQETIKVENLPDSIKEVDEKILKETLVCADCQKNYRIVKPELNFYKKQFLPLPRQCPDCRYYQRFRQRNPHQLWHRRCMKEDCSNEFETSYAPERPEIIYCEECYRKEVY